MRRSTSHRSPPTWNRTCSHCHALLLKGENFSVCCNKRKHIAPALPPLLDGLRGLSSSDCPQRSKVLTLSRHLNNLFSFTSISTMHGFTHFNTGVSDVSITGRTYHRLFDVSKPNHSLRWFLYDENERLECGNRFNVPRTWIDSVKGDLDHVNPYCTSTFCSVFVTHLLLQQMC
jgi:hypothetical protein